VHAAGGRVAVTDSPGRRFERGERSPGESSLTASTPLERAATVRPLSSGGVSSMADQSQSQARSEARRGKTDLVAVLYIAGGIPAIVGFIWLLFAIGVRYCGMPA
jgi:hypothetical protein